MMRADQFVVSKRDFPEGWVRCRRDGVTATQVAKAATPAGFETSVRDHLEEYVEMDNPYMKFGRDMEPVVARMLHQEFGVMPNDWLLRHESVGHHLATPDGLSLDHSVIAEIKTTGKDFEHVSIPIQYRRQVQWQLHVTGAERCLFAWMLRVEVDGMYAPAWWAPKHEWLERDEEMIGTLIGVADELWERVKHG
jgi:predicted phage-related endonuclease